MRFERALPLLTLSMVTAVFSGASAGCLSERHLVGDGLPDGGRTPSDGAMDGAIIIGTGSGGSGATDGGPTSSDSSLPGATVVSLGDKTSLGWAIAIPPEEVARRLSQLMLQRAPTAALTAAVVARAPKTNQDVGDLTDGLLLDQNTLAGRQAFYRWWLNLDSFETQPRDAALFPAFTVGVSAALVEQALAFTEDVTWQPAGNLTTLLTEPAAFITTGTAAWFGGVTAPGGTTAAKVMLDPTRYAGIVTQPAVVATHDFPTRPEPSRRGMDARNRYLCQPVPAPPVNLPAGPLPTGEPLRQAVESTIASAAVCVSCHGLIDSVGFAFGHFDAVGAFHETESNAPVDTTGTLTATSSGASVPFAGAPELANQVAKLPEARACFAAQWLTFAVGTFRNGLVAPTPGINNGPTFGPDPTATPPWNNDSPTFMADVDYVVKRATVQAELNLRGTMRAVTETHSFLEP